MEGLLYVEIWASYVVRNFYGVRNKNHDGHKSPAMAEVTPTSQLLTQESQHNTRSSSDSTKAFPDEEDSFVAETPTKRLFCSQQFEADVEDNCEEDASDKEAIKLAKGRVAKGAYADVEDNCDVDTDEEIAASEADAQAKEYAWMKEEEEFTRLFAEQQTFIPAIYDSDAEVYQRNRRLNTEWKMKADRAAYAAYLKYGWQGRDDLFSIVFETAKKTYLDCVPKHLYTCETDKVMSHCLAAQYAEEVMIHIIMISK